MGKIRFETIGARGTLFMIVETHMLDASDGVLYPAQSWVGHDRAVTAILGWCRSPILESGHKKH